MEDIASLLAWFSANQDTLLAIVQSLLVAATLITGLTKSKSDNAVLDRIKDVLGFLSIVTPKDAPNTFKLPLSKK